MIKSFYYWGLCYTRISGHDYNFYLPTIPGDKMAPEAYVDALVYYWRHKGEKAITENDIVAIRNGKEHHAEYSGLIKDNDIHIFVIRDNQMNCFLDDMQRRGLMQYKVYESPKFSNLNYPANGRCLTLFLFHYKDFKHEV